MGSEFLIGCADYTFPAFIHAGMQLVWGDYDSKAMEEYRTAWFGEDGMVTDSPDHHDAWWRDESTKTLPAQTVSQSPKPMQVLLTHRRCFSPNQWQQMTAMVSEIEILARSASTLLNRARIAEAGHLSHQNDRKQEIHRIIGGLESAHWRGASIHENQ